MGSGWILAVDLGTGGPKTGAVSLRGEVLAQSHAAVLTRYTPDGGAVQDPNDWWRAIKDGVRAVVESKTASIDELAGVGITGQWGSTVPVGADGRAVGDCMLWADTRGGPLASKAVGGPVSLFGYSPGNMVRWIQITGGAPSPNGADPLGHELYLRDSEPQTYAAAKTLLEPLDFLGACFTGRIAATPASMILPGSPTTGRARPQATCPSSSSVQGATPGACQICSQRARCSVTSRRPWPPSWA